MSEENDEVVLNRLNTVLNKYLLEVKYFKLVCFVIGLTRNLLLSALVILLIFRANHLLLMIIAILLLIVVNLESFIAPFQNWRRTKENVKLLELWQIQYLTGTYPFDGPEDHRNSMLLLYIYQFETGVYDADLYI